eukprot:CAMPEP_0172178376 /NCGR_PEP_ID=MMETSP1050-20130122/15994_1 /TAXON_ID=233186 /ORGANISM="Cryptomonas curvata, Strain CCAP979/52" /LENGTH=219 /DNA_ID=CAMNT_0012851073 /DNA_START=15 /DNA_END=670 /DNA_ORIENTATION=-
MARWLNLRLLPPIFLLSSVLTIHVAFLFTDKSELIASPDSPGFDVEATNQIASGNYFDDVGVWEKPGNFNNRALSDLYQSRMDDGMMHDAAASGWYDNGPADFEDPPSALATDYPIDGDSDDGGSVAPAAVDVTYANAWPGTGSGFYSWEDIASDSDGYDGGWDVAPAEAEAADDPAVSRLKARARQQSLFLCDECLAGDDCVAGCRVAALGLAGAPVP